MEEGAGGAAKQLPSVTVSSSRFPLSVSDGDSVGVRPVREEVRVLPTIREALWPQSTDGLRQPPSSSMEPVSERAMGETVVHGCGVATPGIRSFATVRSAAQPLLLPTVSSTQRVGTGSAPDRSSPTLDD
ncbi:hypothetical protein Dimus_015948 [Dionaea muscipula]